MVHLIWWRKISENYRVQSDFHLKLNEMKRGFEKSRVKYFYFKKLNAFDFQITYWAEFTLFRISLRLAYPELDFPWAEFTLSQTIPQLSLPWAKLTWTFPEPDFPSAELNLSWAYPEPDFSWAEPTLSRTFPEPSLPWARLSLCQTFSELSLPWERISLSWACLESKFPWAELTLSRTFPQSVPMRSSSHMTRFLAANMSPPVCLRASSKSFRAYCSSWFILYKIYNKYYEFLSMTIRRTDDKSLIWDISIYHNVLDWYTCKNQWYSKIHVLERTKVE